MDNSNETMPRIFSKRPTTILVFVVCLAVVFLGFSQIVGFVGRRVPTNNEGQQSASVIKGATVTQLPAVPGQPISWRVKVGASTINLGRHLLPLPKNAEQIKITPVKTFETKSTIKKTSVIKETPAPVKSSISEKQKLSELARQNAQSVASVALARSLQSRSSGFFASLWDVFSRIGSSMVAAVEDAILSTGDTTSSDSTTTDAVIVDIAPQVSGDALTSVPEISTTTVATIEASTTSDVATTSDIFVNDVVGTTSPNTGDFASSTATSTATTTAVSDVLVEYKTPTPVIAEATTDTGKIVTVSDGLPAGTLETNTASTTASMTDELPHPTNVLAFTNIPEIYKVGQESKIQIKWKNNNDQPMEFHAYDLNGNGKLDYVEWTVPHLSTQTFEIIFISKAFQLDQDQNIVADIYDTVRSQDGVWAGLTDGQSARVTFAKILNKQNDNTIYARPTNPDQPVIIEVYPVYTDADGNNTEGSKVATFENINREGAYKVYLKDLQTPTDVFDLRVVGNVDIDYIVDPIVWTAYNDSANYANSAYASTGNVTNFGAADASGNLIKYSDATSTGISIAYSGTGLLEGTGVEGVHGAAPIYAPSGDAATEFGTVINLTGISYANSATSLTVTLSGVSSSSKYTLVALGMRGAAYTRWSSYTISNVSSYTNDSSTGIPEADRTGATTKYNAGDNWTNGYVAKWTDIVPTSNTITLTVTGIAYSSYVADKPYLTAIKLLETEDATEVPTISSAASQKFAKNDPTTAISTITITDDASTPTITATNDIRIKIPVSFNMTWDETDTTATFGGTDADHVASGNVTYEDLGKTVVVDVGTNFEAGNTITVSGLSFAGFSATSSVDNLELEVTNGGTSQATDDKTIVVVSPTISSAANQTFVIGEGMMAIQTITVTDDASNPVINSTGDIRIKIPASFNMTWDETDTVATFGGTASAKAGNITYEDANKTLVVDVTSDFTAGQTLTIANLSFSDFSATSSADNLGLEINNANTTTSEDDKTVTVDTATITVSTAVSQPVSSFINTTDNILAVASITRNSGSGSVTAVTIKENGGTIDASADMSNIKVWLSSNTTLDGGDNQLGSTGSFDGVDGEATFTESFSVTTTTQYLIVEGDIGAGASGSETIEIQFKTVASADTVSGTPLNVTGTTTLSPAWWNNDWLYGKTITFTNSAQDENLTDFPIMVKLSSSNFDFSKAQSAGQDLRFVDSDNLTELSYEIESYNAAGQSAIVWVKVPQIDASSNSDFIYMYYGNDSAIDDQSITDVWSNSYEAVYHFAEASGNYLDSTANNHDSDAVSVTSRTGAGIGNCPSFNGSSNYITIPDSAGFDHHDYTISAYVKCAGTGVTVGSGTGGTTVYPIIAKGMAEAETAAADVQFFFGFTTTPAVSADFENDTNAPNSGTSQNAPVTGGTTLTCNNSAFYYVTDKVDTTNDTFRVYNNGAQDGTVSTAYWPSIGGTQKVGIGTALVTGGTRTGYWNGLIDEVRIEDVARSADWIAAQSKSVNSTFNTFGEEEVGITSTSIASAANQTFMVDGGVTAISKITVTDGSTAAITAANDIRIKIPASFNMEWDTTDTTATIGGTASAKVSGISYPDAKTLLINVDTNFANLDTLTIENISFKNFTDVSSADNLDLVIAGSGGSVATVDSKTITVSMPTITVTSSTSQPATVYTNTVNDTLGSASIARSVGTSQVTAVTIKENGGTVDAANELRNIKLYLSADDTWDAGDTQIGDTGIFNGADGEITFTENFNVTATPQYLIVRGDVKNTATVGSTIELQFKTITSTDTISGAPLSIAGTSTIATIAAVITQVQQATATHTYLSPATSITVTISPAVAGNLLVTAIATDKIAGTYTIPDDFTLINSYVGTVSVSQAMAYKVATGGETTITWSTSNSEESSAWVGEYSGISLSSPLDVSATANSVEVTVQSQTTGTTAATAQVDELAIAMFSIDSASNASGRSWTNSFAETSFVGLTSTAGLGVATKTLSSTDAQTTTASWTGVADQAAGSIATFKAAAVGSPIDISSAGNQTFFAGGSATAISAITITDDTSSPAITAVNDIRIKIPATFNMVWNTNDTSAVIAGDAADHVSGTVSYEDAGKTLLIDVTSDFEAGESFTISGLSFGTFSAFSAADNLELEIFNDGSTDVTDDKTIFIAAPVISSAANKSFNVGDSATSISAITVTDSASSPVITAANNIRIKIPAGLNMTWNTASAPNVVITGTASGKLSATGLISPYEPIVNRYLVNLHGHTTNSDGGQSPTAYMETYRSLGYTAAAITDHDYLTSDPGVSGIIWLGGVENTAGGGHMGSLNITSRDSSGVRQQQVDSAIGQGGFANIHHPSSGWTNDAIVALNNFTSMEIWNSHYSGLAAYADYALSHGKQFWLTADDDLHGVTQIYRGWNVVLSSKSAGEITKADIVHELMSGNFYALGRGDGSGSPSVDQQYANLPVPAEFTEISVSSATVTTSIDKTANIQFITNNGTVSQTNNSTTTASYVSSPGDVYVRIVVTFTSGGKSAYSFSNPIYVGEVQSGAVTFEDGDKTLVVDVGENFDAGDAVTISGLKFDNFDSGGSGQLTLVLGGASGAVAATDSKTITIVGDPPTASIVSVTANSATQLTVAATAVDSGIGLDLTTPYQFSEISGNTGGSSSDWQVSPFVDTGLSPNTQYSYKVRARDPFSNASDYSATSSKYTLASVPGTPVLTVDSASQITVALASDSNPSGTLYLITNNNSTNSGWTSNSSWVSSGLTCDTAYTFEVMAKNSDSIETATSTASATTSDCSATIVSAVGSSSSGGSSRLSVPYLPPSIPVAGFSAQINNGANVTDTQDVILYLKGSADTIRMSVSNDPGFSNAIQEPYAIQKQWRLTDGEGQKIVYIKFFSNSGVPSDVIIASINYQEPSVFNPIINIVNPLPTPVLPTDLPLSSTEQVVPTKAPNALSDIWDILPMQSVGEAVSQPLVRELNVIAQKFPQLKTQKVTDLEKLYGGGLTLPGLSEAIGFTLSQGIPLSQLTAQLKEQIPTDVVFVRSGNGTIDKVTSISVSSKGGLQQKVNAVAGQNIQLIIKPENATKAIKGYLTFKQNTAKPTTQSTGKKMKVSSLAATTKGVENYVNEALVVKEFNYEDKDKDGIWTADILAPVVDGEYEIINVLQYTNPELLPKELRLVMVIDPEGYVYYQTDRGETRIENAKVSLFWLNSKTNGYELWPAKDYKQTNPQLTDNTGSYSFFTPPGTYYLSIEADGYGSYKGESINVVEGHEIHQNISLQRGLWFSGYLDWKAYIVLFGIIVVFIFYRAMGWMSVNKKIVYGHK